MSTNASDDATVHWWDIKTPEVKPTAKAPKAKAKAVGKGGWQPKAEKDIEELWMLIQAEYEQQGTTNRIGSLTPSMIKSGEHFPCLATKAAENSHLIPVMAEVCRKLSNESDADETPLCACPAGDVVPRPKSAFGWRIHRLQP